MHSRIFVLRPNPENSIFTTEDELFDNLHDFYSNGADYVCEESRDSRKDSLEWLLETYQTMGILTEDSTPESITFTEDASETFFQKRYETLQKQVAEMTLKEFSSMQTIDIYSLQELVESRNGFYVVLCNGGVYPEDEFFRTELSLGTNRTFYPGQTYDYHF